MHYLKITLTMVVMICATGVASAADHGFKPIFDGETLGGWKAPNMSHWSVEDGAITGKNTAENPCKGNQFIVWQDGEVDDFELKLEFRITGDEARANSGIQFRGKVRKDGHVIGYQADMDMAGNWLGALYDEAKRGILARPMHRGVVDENGKKSATKLEGKLTNKKGDWNEYRVIAKGNQITLMVNGVVSAEVTDNQPEKRDLIGVLALQLHQGPPMTVQFRNIQLKRLPLENRKKVVFLAGTASHGWGAHEHNAGCMLLASKLNRNASNALATVYKNGWPKDPTAFDNADTVVIYCDGGRRHMTMGHFDQIEAMIAKGIGFACLHYGVEVPKGEPGDRFLNWLGGYFETHWSVNPHWTAEFKKLPEHEICEGVAPFSIRDEWYFHMRFNEDDKRVTPILSAVAPMDTIERKDGPHSGNPAVRKEVEAGVPQHVAWAFERKDGGRAFGFTGGHFHDNWAHDDFRKLVLNAVLWTAKADVPAGGVPSATPNREELDANQDYPDRKPKRK